MLVGDEEVERCEEGGLLSQVSKVKRGKVEVDSKVNNVGCKKENLECYHEHGHIHEPGRLD